MIRTRYESIEDRLELYKVALKDFESPLSMIQTGYFGFCMYFKVSHGIVLHVIPNDQQSDDFLFQSKLPELYEQRRFPNLRYHYLPKATEIEGIQVRAEALRKAIELTETKIKELANETKL